MCIIESRFEVRYGTNVTIEIVEHSIVFKNYFKKNASQYDVGCMESVAPFLLYMRCSFQRFELKVMELNYMQAIAVNKFNPGLSYSIITITIYIIKSPQCCNCMC